MDYPINRRRNKHIARQGEEFVWIDVIALGKRPQVSFLKNVLLGSFDINSFWIVDRGRVIADAHDFNAAFVCERKCGHRADVAKALNDGRALFRIDLQHVHSALDQVNDTASSRFAAAFSPANGDRFAGNDLVHGVAHVHRVGIHEPSHDLFVSAHVRAHDVGVRTDERNHLLHVTAGERFQFVTREF